MSDDQKRKEIEECKKKAEEYLNGWKRAKADYLNLKKEVEEERKEFIKFSNLALILNLLPILNNLKRVLEHENSKDQAVMEGIKQIKKQFEDLLSQAGLEDIETAGKKFDPMFHEAIGKEKKENMEQGMIIKEAESGYTMYGKVILPAKVIVAE